MARQEKKRPKPAESKLATALAAIAEAQAHLKLALAALQTVGVALNTAERQASAGKVRVAEASVLATVLDVAEAHPELTAGHADKDGGVDPTAFEAPLLREWLDLHKAFAAAADGIEAQAAAIVSLLGDSAMFYGARARRPTLRVYRDLAALAHNNATLQRELAEAIAYYGGISRKAARTRARARAQQKK